MRPLNLVLLMLLLSVGAAAQTVDSVKTVDSTRTVLADSTRTRLDTVLVIPGGPVAGTMTEQARVTVVDTIAGWARIQMEGWVPYAAVASRMNPADTPAPAVSGKEVATPPVERQCTATTTKGQRCKRKAMPGRRYCWQHQK